jgi:hypothetical protein
MMMRVLGEGGIPTLTDGVRAADVDNPRGYFEFEPVKSTRQDPSWIPRAIGKVVKMVHQLLLDLPLTYHYRVVFMRRNLSEVIQSQDRMLERLNQPLGELAKSRLTEIFQAQMDQVLAYLRAHVQAFRFIEIDYNAMVHAPQIAVARVSDFLDGLDVEKAVGAVEAALYRNRGAG